MESETASAKWDAALASLPVHASETFPDNTIVSYVVHVKRFVLKASMGKAFCQSSIQFTGGLRAALRHHRVRTARNSLCWTSSTLNDCPRTILDFVTMEDIRLVLDRYQGDIDIEPTYDTVAYHYELETWRLEGPQRLSTVMFMGIEFPRTSTHVSYSVDENGHLKHGVHYGFVEFYHDLGGGVQGVHAWAWKTYPTAASRRDLPQPCIDYLEYLDDLKKGVIRRITDAIGFS